VAFCEGHKLYIARHDGTAATIEDFVAAMADANGIDLSAFWHWYQEAGTPNVKVSTHYDPQARCFELTLEQSHHQPRASPKNRLNLFPITIGLMGPDGQAQVFDGGSTLRPCCYRRPKMFSASRVFRRNRACHLIGVIPARSR